MTSSLFDCALLLPWQNEPHAGLQVGNETLSCIERHRASHDDTSLRHCGCRNAKMLNPSDKCCDVILYFDRKPRHERTIDEDGFCKRYQRQFGQHLDAPCLLLCEKGGARLLRMLKMPSESWSPPAAQLSNEKRETFFNLRHRGKSKASSRSRLKSLECAAVHFNQDRSGFRNVLEAA